VANENISSWNNNPGKITVFSILNMRQDCPKHLKRTNTNNIPVGEITPEE
jgi:hypothetical protein